MSTSSLTGLQRILAGSVNPKLRVTLLGQDGDAEAATGTLTCTITRADGTAVATGRATAAGANGAGSYTCELTTDEARTLDVLTAVWSDAGVARATTHHRIVGGFLFSIAELGQRAGVVEDFNQAELRAQRDRITDLVEHYTGIAWSPRYDRDEFEGHGHRRHGLPWRPVTALREVTIEDTAVVLADLDLDHRSGIISGVTFAGWCEVGYEHGHTAPPADLRDAAITAAADGLRRDTSAVSRRARSVSDGLGVTQQFGWAGEGHPTGIDEVDAVLNRYARARI